MAGQEPWRVCGLVRREQREVSLNAKRKARKKHATPPWADHAAIQRFYDEASRLTRETGIRHEVDHIIPLQGRNVTGFHHQDNLQILTRSENARKSNRFASEAA